MNTKKEEKTKGRGIKNLHKNYSLERILEATFIYNFSKREVIDIKIFRQDNELRNFYLTILD